MPELGEKFIGKGSNISQCFFCERWNTMEGPACTAYPAGVPRSILSNSVDHREEHEGDHGLQFKAVPGLEFPAHYFE